MRSAVFFTALLATNFLLNLPAALAKGSAMECELQNRTMAFFPANLPDDIEVRILCTHESIEMKAFYIAKLDFVERSKLISWFKTYERSQSPEVLRTLLTEKSGTNAEDTQLKFESELKRQNRITHYLFTAPAKDGQTLVFIYSDDAKNAQSQSGRIHTLIKTFKSQSYLEAIVNAL